MERKYIMQLPRGAKVSSTDIKYEDGKIVLTAQLEEWRPKDGEICFAETFHGSQKFIIIFGHNDYSLNYNMSRTDKWTLEENCQWTYSKIRPATEEERKKLFAAMAKEGKRWNTETKNFENVRWRAMSGGKYYYLIFGNGDYGISETADIKTRSDNSRYLSGNYFKTEEAARIAGNHILELLKKLKAE